MGLYSFLNDESTTKSNRPLSSFVVQRSKHEKESILDFIKGKESDNKGRVIYQYFKSLRAA